MASRRRESSQPPLRTARPRSGTRPLGEEWLQPRRVEAAAALAHDPRRVPRARLPAELAFPSLRIRGISGTARGSRAVPRRHRQARGNDRARMVGGDDEASCSGSPKDRGRLRIAPRRHRQGIRFVSPARAQLPLPLARHDGRQAKPWQGHRSARLAPVPDAPFGCRARASPPASVPQARLPGRRQPRAADAALRKLTSSTRRGWLHERSRTPHQGKTSSPSSSCPTRGSESARTTTCLTRSSATTRRRSSTCASR